MENNEELKSDHTHILDLTNQDIKITDDSCLLFIEVEGKFKGLNESDLITIFHYGVKRKVTYQIYNITYRKNNSFKSQLIFIQFEN
jgi:hypothetical protein